MSWGGHFRPRSTGHRLQEREVFEYGHSRSYRAPPQRMQNQRQFYRNDRVEDDYVDNEDDEGDYDEGDYVEEADDDDDDEIIPLPDDLIRKFGKLTCELCLCTLPSVKQANMHYEGKQHEKRVMRYLEEWSSATNRKIPNCWLRLVRKRKQSAKLPSGSSDKFCTVCNIVLTSAVVASQHYAGRAHNTALKNYKGKKSTRDMQSAAKSTFMCDICNIVTSCQEHLENHMRGSKHKKVLMRLKEAENLEMFGGYEDENEDIAQEQEPDYNVIQSSGSVQYECVYCTWRGAPADFEAHKEKLTHIAAVEEESKKNVDSDNNDDDDDDIDGTEYTDVTDLFCKLCNVQLTSKKEVAKHVRSRDHLGEVNLRKKQVLLSLDDPEKAVVVEEHKCDLCLMKFPSKSMYDAHLQWKRHIKKLANKLQSESKKRCELCQMDFFSEQMYNAHLTTKRHLSNEHWLKKRQSKTDTVSETINSVTGDDNGADKNTTIKSSEIESCGTDSTVSLVESSNVNPDEQCNAIDADSNVKVSGDNLLDKQLNTVDTDSNVKSSGGDIPDEKASVKVSEESDLFECEVCEIKVHGRLPYEQHLISMRHILQYNLKQATVTVNTEEKNVSAKNAPSSKFSLKANKPLFCKLCHVTSLTNYQHELHLTSKKHKEAVTKLEVSKFEPKLKMAFYKPATVSQTLATERKSDFHVSENYDQPVFNIQGSFKQFENTPRNEAFDSTRQETYFVPPSAREMPNMPSHFESQRPLTVTPNMLPAATSQSYFPHPPVTVASYVTPVPVVQNTQAARQVEAHNVCGKTTESPPPIRRSTYSCTYCRASFISGVDYTHHIKICNKRGKGEGSKDLPAKTAQSQSVLQNNPYFCEACDVEYTSYRTFLEHKASAEHEANIEHLREFGKRLKPVGNERGKSDPSKHILSREKEKGLHINTPFECKRCDVSFFSKLDFNRHINSAAHLRKPAILKREVVTIERKVTRLLSPDSDERRERRSSREVESRNWRKRGAGDSTDKHTRDFKRFESSDSPSDSDVDEMDLVPFKKTKSVYKCNLCYKVFFHEHEYKNHLQSKNHISKMHHECYDCGAVFSSKHDLADHVCVRGGRNRNSESSSWLQTWDEQEQAEQDDNDIYQFENDDVDENVATSRNLMSFRKQSESSLLSTFSFRKETYEIMSDNPGMSSFNY